MSEPTCYCYNCNKDRMVGGFPYVMTRMIVCPTCGCASSTDEDVGDDADGIYTRLARPE